VTIIVILIVTITVILIVTITVILIVTITSTFQKEKSEKMETKLPFIDLWIKSMLVGREGDGYPVFQEDFLRQVSID
jgi:hypothetical protein